MGQVEVRSRQLMLFARMLGVVMLILMGKLIGNNGIAYLAAAVETFTVLALALVQCVPDVLGKLLRSRRTKEQYQNADRMRLSVMLLQLVLGILGAALLLIFADGLASSLFQIPYSAFVIRLLAPVLLLRVAGSLLEGDFQGNGSRMPQVTAAFLRQILIIAFGYIFVPMFKGYGEKVENLLLNENMPSMYGAAGLATAMIIAEVLVFVFLLVLYLGNGRSKKSRDGLKRTEGFVGSLRLFYVSMCFPVLIHVLARIAVPLGMIFYQRKAQDAAAAVWDYGTYYGGYLTLCAFPILLCGIVLLPVAARAASGIRRSEPRFARDMGAIGIHIGLMYTLFPAAYITVMAEPLGKVFGADQAETLTRLLRTGAFLIVEVGLAAFFIRVLMNMGKTLWALGALGIFVAVFVMGVMVLVNGMALGVPGLCFAGLLAGGVLCVLTGAFLAGQLRMRVDLLGGIAVPLSSALFSGLICFLLAEPLRESLGDVAALLICLVLGILFYLAPQLLLRSFSEPELRLLPGGALLRKLSELSPLIKK